METNPSDIELLNNALKGAGFLPHLSPQENRKLLYAFDKVEISKGFELINQGTAGKVFYILASGSVGVYLKRAILDKKVATLKPGSFFGEMSLLTNAPREATVICEEDGVVFTLLQNDFNDIIMRNPYLADIIKKAIKKREKENHDIELKERMSRNPD